MNDRTLKFVHLLDQNPEMVCIQLLALMPSIRACRLNSNFMNTIFLYCYYSPDISVRMQTEFGRYGSDKYFNERQFKVRDDRLLVIIGELISMLNENDFPFGKMLSFFGAYCLK